MKAVLRQQWELHKNRILIVIAIFAFLYILSWGSAIIANKELEKAVNLMAPSISEELGESLTLDEKLELALDDDASEKLHSIAYGSKTKQFSEIIFFVTVIMGTLGTFIICVGKGAGCAEDMLFKDTSYLMKTIPRTSWSIFAGKLIIGLLEFFMYCIMFTIFLLIYLSIHTVMFTDISVFSALKDIIKVIIKQLPDIINIALFTLLFYIFMQITVNFTLTTYYALCRDKKWTKILLFVFAVLFVRFAVKVTSFFVDFENFDIIEKSAELWPPVLILTGIAGIYYVLTCIIYDKKINL